MPSRKTGEGSHLLTFVRDGNISSTTTLRFSPFLLQFCGALTWVLQIDKDRAVAAGASYGGYAIKWVLGRFFATMTKAVPSWIQSNPEFGFGFKALVCHDGVREVAKRLVLHCLIVSPGL